MAQTEVQRRRLYSVLLLFFANGSGSNLTSCPEVPSLWHAEWLHYKEHPYLFWTLRPLPLAHAHLCSSRCPVARGTLRAARCVAAHCVPSAAVTATASACPLGQTLTKRPRPPPALLLPVPVCRLSGLDSRAANQRVHTQPRLPRPNTSATPSPPRSHGRRSPPCNHPPR